MTSKATLVCAKEILILSRTKGIPETKSLAGSAVGAWPAGCGLRSWGEDPTSRLTRLPEVG